MDQINARLQRIEEAIQRLDYSIRGNGTKGLNSMFQEVNAKVNTLWKVVIVMAGSILTGSVSIVVWAITR